jgi:Xaa-Pro aminopeptidase
LVLLEKRSIIFLDGRYKSYGVHLEDDDLEVCLIKEGSFFSSLNEALENAGTEHIWFEKKHLTYSQFCRLKRRLGVNNREYGSDWIEKIRQQKEAVEIDAITTATSRTLEVFKNVESEIKAGISEFDLNRFLRMELEKEGESRAFYPIVLFGERCCCPHAPPSDKKLKAGEPVLIDIGLKYRGYCSDLTRMFFCGKREGLAWKLYRLSARAAMVAFSKMHPGVEISTVAKAARELIINEGYEKGLRHSLGHSLGLDIHESPALKCSNSDKLKEGMIVTVEPGIYLEGETGGRIEHMVLITASGARLIDEPDPYLEEELEFYGNTE